jgi:hypothetical protein
LAEIALAKGGEFGGGKEDFEGGGGHLAAKGSVFTRAV